MWFAINGDGEHDYLVNLSNVSYINCITGKMTMSDSSAFQCNERQIREMRALIEKESHEKT